MDNALTPFAHQTAYMRAHAADRAHALFWEQGTAKTKPVIDNAAELYLAGEIDCLLVNCPRGADRNWVNEELPKHLSRDILEATHCYFYSNGQTKANATAQATALNFKGLSVITVKYDSWVTQRCKNFVWKVLRKRKCFYVCDETGSGIKTPKAKRTKSIVASGRYAKYRRILDGTPVAEGPFDVYAPVKFLDENFWKRRGIATFGAFKMRYGRWLTATEARAQLGWDPGYDQLVEYQNLDELHGYLDEIGSRVLKEQCLDLPPKLYGRLFHDLTAEQQSIYDELKENYVVQFPDGATVTAEIAIVRLLRFQQITCGYLPVDGEPARTIGKVNPRLDCLLANAEHLTSQAIVWCRFIRDIELVCDALGQRAVPYHGRGLSDEDLERHKVAFQKGDAQFFVANSQMSTTLTLHVARTVFFYSNSFKLRDRLQAEDRAHRAGLKHSVDYRDIVCAGTPDERIVDALRGKLDISRLIMGDGLREWL